MSTFTTGPVRVYLVVDIRPNPEKTAESGTRHFDLITEDAGKMRVGAAIDTVDQARYSRTEFIVQTPGVMAIKAIPLIPGAKDLVYVALLIEPDKSGPFLFWQGNECYRFVV
jgi:hypothetical protein